MQPSIEERKTEEELKSASSEDKSRDDLMVPSQEMIQVGKLDTVNHETIREDGSRVSKESFIRSSGFG